MDFPYPYGVWIESLVTYEASVEHAPGLSGVGRAVGGGGVLEPPTFSENPGEFSSPLQNPGGHLPGILGKSGILASSDSIIRGCTDKYIHDLAFFAIWDIY